LSGASLPLLVREKQSVDEIWLREKQPAKRLPGFHGVTSCKKRLKFAGDHTARVPPVPISNTEVKPRWADGTARVSVWEIR
jgi:hypothetical protein